MTASSLAHHAYPIHSDVYVGLRRLSLFRQLLPYISWNMSSAVVWLKRIADADADGAGTGRSDNYAYLVVDDQSREAVIIDPAHPSEYVILFIH